MSKFIIATSKSDEKHINDITIHMVHCLIYNYIILFENDQDTTVRVDDVEKKQAMIVINLKLILKRRASPIIYPDRSRNAVYKILAFKRPPLVHSRGKKTVSRYFYFFDTLAKIQNSTLVYEWQNNSFEPIEIQKVIHTKKLQRAFHIALIHVNMLESYPKLEIYEEDPYCIVVPLRRFTIVQAIFFAPFDKTTWILLFVSVVVAVLGWKLLQKSDASSHWRFLSEMLANMVAQSLSLRSKRKVLLLLLQIFIFSIFYLRNLYEGVVTSIMSERSDFIKYQTFEKLLESNSDVKLFLSKAFFMKNYSKLERWQDRIYFDTELKTPFEMAESNFVIINICSEIELFMKLRGGEEFYYMIPEKINNQLLKLDVGFTNPYLERWQLIMDRAIETGLMQIWKKFHKNAINPIMSRASGDENNDAVPLSIKDLYQVFLIVPFGLVLALLIFLIELFYHDCVSKLSINLLKSILCRKNVKP